MYRRPHQSVKNSTVAYCTLLEIFFTASRRTTVADQERKGTADISTVPFLFSQYIKRGNVKHYPEARRSRIRLF